MSRAVDDDAARAAADARETLGAMLSAAQSQLKKVFIVFVIGLIGTIWVLRNLVWHRMKADLHANIPPEVDVKVIAVTPFDVILLQVKIGLIIGILLAIPFLIFYSRDALRERGWWPSDHVPRWKLLAGSAVGLGLFVAGITYGYSLFFPLAFAFLASNAAQAGFQPTYSIVKWAEFIFLLSLSFGLAAQLPLVMSALAYARIVPYETFRTYWKHAIVALYAFGALFTPPDPITQLMWATPLVVLYGVSLVVTKFVVKARDAGERIGIRRVARQRWRLLYLVGLAVTVVVYVPGSLLVTGWLDGLLARLPYVAPGLGRDVSLLGLSETATVTVLAIAMGLLVTVALLVRLTFSALDELLEGDRRGAPAGSTEVKPAPASTGSPAAIDLDGLDEQGIRAAPIERFTEMDEEEALGLASRAMERNDPDAAQAILDRFDEAQELVAAEPVETGATAAAANELAGEEADSDEATQVPAGGSESGSGGGNVVSNTAAGMVDAFTDEETTEDDIGGYYYDIAFVLDSLTSRAFRLVGLFMAVLALTFFALYRGGIGIIKRDFLSRLPPGVTPDEVGIVVLHPVEALIFEIKVSVIFAAVATLPLLLYYAWPALRERGFVGGNRDTLVGWAGAMFAGLVIGSAIGYAVVAPSIISWLAGDVLQAHMVIAYRINSFGWLVFLTTVGVGLLADIPVTMFMFHRGGLVSYRAMRGRWKIVTLGTLAVIAFLSPRGVFMMFILGIPILLSYGLGLAVLWLYTLGGRRSPRRRGRRAD